MANALLGRADNAFALFSFLNPVARTASREDVVAYKVEPYAVAADIYSEPPHTGRGGWTWYTGSAGRVCPAGIEEIPGVRLRGQVQALAASIPRHLDSCHGLFKFRSPPYRNSVGSTP